MTYQTIHDGRYSGEWLEPEERVSDNSEPCVECLIDLDVDEDEFFERNESIVCASCMTACALCGELLDNTHFPDHVVIINFRDAETDGKLSKDHCPACAAATLIGSFLGIQNFEATTYTRERIAQLLYPEANHV